MACASFKVLTLCRKVCTNRDEAEQLWGACRVGLPQPQLGLLVPWFVLQTVRSLTSLALQPVELLGGGQNAWECKPGLRGKIQQQISRLGLECGDFG